MMESYAPRGGNRLRAVILAAIVSLAAVAALALAGLAGLDREASAQAAPAPDVFATDQGGANNLLRFNSANPGTIISSIPITGLGADEDVYDLDFRPANGQLYGLVYNGDSVQNLIYRINPQTGVATQITPTSFSDTDSFAGLDFNPTVDRIRAVNGDDENYRINPDNGDVTTDTALAYANSDANAAEDPNIVGAAYTNNRAGATSTMLFDIDTNLDILARQDPPDGGVLNTIGPLGVDTDSDNVGFDVGSNRVAYAALVPEAASSSSNGEISTQAVVTSDSDFYTINLGTGAATRLGDIGGGGAIDVDGEIRGIAVVPAGDGGGTPPDDGGGNPNACTKVGTQQGDILEGTPRRDVICGRGGNDIIKGLGGNDLLRGQGGDDILRGDSGNDTIVGGSGRDVLKGEGGNDTLRARDRVKGNDAANGGPGNDSCQTDRRDIRNSC